MADSRVSVTKYLRPLLPAGTCFQSHCSSKLANWAFVMISPPPLPRPCNQPSSITQPFVGNDSRLNVRHSLVVLPSKSNCQPAAFSSFDKMLTGPPALEWATSIKCRSISGSAGSATASELQGDTPKINSDSKMTGAETEAR